MITNGFGSDTLSVTLSDTSVSSLLSFSSEFIK
uniref:Uncharacterized protein n=1 Tax=viral metagenome TaxID=1070528 RepID=A0A6C0D3H8_9ZZZZ